MKKEFLGFKEARKMVRGLKLKDTVEWKEYCKSGKKPNNIPANVYYYKEFVDFYDWLGNNRKTYMPFKKVKNLVKKMGIKNQNEWFRWARSGKKPSNVPYQVDLVYKKEWVDWYDFFQKPKNYLPYKDASRLMRKLNIKTIEEYRRLNREKYNLPVNPHMVYKQWKNWFDFLGKDRRDGGRIYKLHHNYFKKWSHDMAYIVGIIFADGYIGQRTINLTLHEKDKYLLKKILRKLMPARTPRIGYNGNARTIYISSINVVRDIVKIFEKDKKYLRHNMPNVPKKYLPDFIRGLWDGDGTVWRDKYSRGYRSGLTSFSMVFLTQIQKILQTYIKGLRGHIERIEYYKGTPICGHFLTKDSTTYQLNFGFNDTRKVRDFMYSSPSDLKMIRKYEKFIDAGKICLARKDRRKTYWKFNIARRYARKLHMKNLKEWGRYCLAGNKPYQIPAAPHMIYKEWNGYKDWLGTK